MANPKQTSGEKIFFFEQYKLVVGIADNLTERRSRLNQFYITLLSSIFAVILLVLKGEIDGSVARFSLLTVSLIGMVISYVWRENVKSYKALSKAKFDLINDMEKELPYPYFTKEWSELKKAKYPGLTKWELRLPGLIGLVCLLSFMYQSFSYLTVIHDLALCIKLCL